MEKNEKLQIFAKLISDDYYFTCDTEKNLWEWYDEKEDMVIIYGENTYDIYGVDRIGQMAAALDLCCAAEWNTYTDRLEIRVH